MLSERSFWDVLGAAIILAACSSQPPEPDAVDAGEALDAAVPPAPDAAPPELDAQSREAAADAAPPPVSKPQYPTNPCAFGLKPCDGQCVRADNPDTGCGEWSCSPCPEIEHAERECGVPWTPGVHPAYGLCSYRCRSPGWTKDPGRNYGCMPVPDGGAG